MHTSALRWHAPASSLHLKERLCHNAAVCISALLQAAFQALLEPLKNLNYDALDVAASLWFDDFQRFSFGVRDLELLLCNVIEGAYEGTAGVMPQLELTEVRSLQLLQGCHWGTGCMHCVAGAWGKSPQGR